MKTSYPVPPKDSLHLTQGSICDWKSLIACLGSVQLYLVKNVWRLKFAFSRRRCCSEICLRFHSTSMFGCEKINCHKSRFSWQTAATPVDSVTLAVPCINNLTKTDSPVRAFGDVTVMHQGSHPHFTTTRCPPKLQRDNFRRGRSYCSATQLPRLLNDHIGLN